MNPAPIAFLPPAQPMRVLIGAVLVDMVRHKATVGHQAVPLTYAEFRVLEALILANGKPVSRTELSITALHRTLNSDCDGDDRSIDQLVYSLRQKLPADRFGLPLVCTARGLGYWVSPGEPV